MDHANDRLHVVIVPNGGPGEGQMVAEDALVAFAGYLANVKGCSGATAECYSRHVRSFLSTVAGPDDVVDQGRDRTSVGRLPRRGASRAGAAQVAQVRRTVTKKGKKSLEVGYLITSADHVAAPPATLAAWVQGHWSIDSRLHWVRDVTFGQDGSHVRTGQAPRIMATLRNAAISLLRRTGWDNIAQALRHQARTPERAFTCTLTG